MVLPDLRIKCAGWPLVLQELIIKQERTKVCLLIGQEENMLVRV